MAGKGGSFYNRTLFRRILFHGMPPWNALECSCFLAIWTYLKFYFHMEKFVVYYNTTNFLKSFAGGGEKGTRFWTA